MAEQFDLVILGGGPAGLAAAAYALYARMRVALVSPDMGGKVSYPFALRDVPTTDTVWGASLVREFADKAAAELQHYIQDSATGVTRASDGSFTVHLSAGSVVTAGAVIVCTGARPARLFVNGEMEYWGRGVSFSAISHAPLFAGRDVAVIGGGDRALEATRILTTLARNVYYIAARPQHTTDLATAEKTLSHPKVTVFRGWEVQQIAGDGYVTSVDLVGVNGEVRCLPVEGVFVQLGLLPNNAAVRDLVAVDSYGHVIVNEHCATSVPGVFAAGDVDSVHAEQVTVSLGEGAKAALSAWHYLAGRA